MTAVAADIPDLRLGPPRLAFGTPRGSRDPSLRTTALDLEITYMGSGLVASARLQLLYNMVVAVLAVELKLSDHML